MLLVFNADVVCVVYHLQDFDKFEMILQADDYEKGAVCCFAAMALCSTRLFCIICSWPCAAQDITLDDFFQSTAGKFRTPLVQSWAAELTSQRHARLQHEAKQL